MRAKKIILASLAIGGSLSLSAQGAADLAGKLANLPHYTSDATFEVLLPSAQDPVVYDISLLSESTQQADSLSPCNYVIDWSTSTSAGEVSGFSAYFSGNHYRYRNNRLQEYHFASNEAVFLPNGPGSKRQGVQYTAQFTDLLPQMLAEKILEITSDTSYVYTYTPDTKISGSRAIVLEGAKRGNGYDVMRFTYVFDYATALPVSIELQTSPESISEQIITVTYTPFTGEAITISEDGLMERWPEVFEKFRSSTFKAESLVGTSMPSMACQLMDSSDRFTHHSDEGFPAPALFVFLDPEVSTTARTVEAIRGAAAMAPMDVEVYWVFATNDTDKAKEALSTLGHGEKALVSANSLVRNCGITLYPTTILVDRDAKVKDVLPGYNNDLGLVVLQKIMLLK